VLRRGRVDLDFVLVRTLFVLVRTLSRRVGVGKGVPPPQNVRCMKGTPNGCNAMEAWRPHIKTTYNYVSESLLAVFWVLTDAKMSWRTRKCPIRAHVEVVAAPRCTIRWELQAEAHILRWLRSKLRHGHDTSRAHHDWIVRRIENVCRHSTPHPGHDDVNHRWCARCFRNQTKNGWNNQTPLFNWSLICGWLPRQLLWRQATRQIVVAT